MYNPGQMKTDNTHGTTYWQVGEHQYFEESNARQRAIWLCRQTGKPVEILQCKRIARTFLAYEESK